MSTSYLYKVRDKEGRLLQGLPRVDTAAREDVRARHEPGRAQAFQQEQFRALGTVPQQHGGGGRPAPIL